MNRLHEKGLIEDPVNKAKAVVLTEKGLAEAARLFKALFVKESGPELATEAKSIVALAFRNGPIEDIHAGKECPVCVGKPEYSHITQDEMKNIMKQAVDTVYNLLWLKQNDPEKYSEKLEYGDRCTRLWDDPTGHG